MGVDSHACSGIKNADFLYGQVQPIKYCYLITIAKGIVKRTVVDCYLANYGNYERQSSDCIACGQCDSVCPPLTIISFLRDGEFSATKDYCLFV